MPSALAAVLVMAAAGSGAQLASSGWPEPVSARALTGYLRIGAFYLEAVTPDGTVRIRNDGSSRYAVLTGRGSLSEDGARGYVLDSGNGNRWRFEPSLAGSHAMIEPQRGGAVSYARLAEAWLPRGERRVWSYDTVTQGRNCGPVGRFGLTSPRCVSTTWERPAAVLSSRGIALVANYRSAAPGPGFRMLTALTVYDIRGCAITDGWDACRGKAQPLRPIAAGKTVPAR